MSLTSLFNPSDGSGGRQWWRPYSSTTITNDLEGLNDSNEGLAQSNEMATSNQQKTFVSNVYKGLSMIIYHS